MRARARWGITPLLAAPAGAWALGLGDIELQSALNQPFRAEIALSATTDEMQGLRVTLAAPDTFDRYGLDRPGFLNSFEFRVVADRSGRNVVQITSRESIAEPFVTLLLEATWPRGRDVARVHRVARSARVAAGPGDLAGRAARGNALIGQQRAAAVRSTVRRRRHRLRQHRHRHRRPRTVTEHLEDGSSSTPRAPAAATGGVYGPCSEPRRSGRSRIDSVPTASRSIK